MMKKRLLLSLLIIWASVPLTVPLAARDTSWEMNFSGEFSAWEKLQSTTGLQYTLGGRYLPGARFLGEINDTWNWDAEIRGNLSGLYTNDETTGVSTDFNAKPYRLWGRFYTDQLEIRLGRQEISFGPGKILRAVKWFDQKDSRDPTGFSEGVNALLLRYYFENNANIWVWSLAGNENVMGNASLPSARNGVEVGGRYQMPLGPAEIAVSLHQRTADFRSLSGYTTVPALQALSGNQLAEHKIGLDIVIDLVAGVYAEISQSRLATNTFYPQIQTQYLLGADYTFDVGDGLSATAELFGLSNHTSNLDSTYSAVWTAAGLTDDPTWMGAMSFQYGLTLLDSAQLFAFHVPSYDFTMLQAVWSRAYDTVTLNTSLFSGQCPGTLSASTVQESLLPGAACGIGIQFLIQYNH